MLTTKLIISVINNKYDDVNRLLADRVKINEKDYSSNTALILACRCGNMAIVKLLLER